LFELDKRLFEKFWKASFWTWFRISSYRKTIVTRTWIKFRL